jgi:hypothetical protein
MGNQEAPEVVETGPVSHERPSDHRSMAPPETGVADEASEERERNLQGTSVARRFYIPRHGHEVNELTPRNSVEFGGIPVHGRAGRPARTGMGQ